MSDTFGNRKTPFDALGFGAPDRGDGPTAQRECRHCGNTVLASRLAEHERTCSHRPEELDAGRVDESPRKPYTPSPAARARIERWDEAMKAVDVEWTGEDPPPGFRWECYSKAGREVANEENRELFEENIRLNRQHQEDEEKRAKWRQETGSLRHALNRQFATLNGAREVLYDRTAPLALKEARLFAVLGKEENAVSVNREQLIQDFSDAGAMCGVCGSEPGDRDCPKCEKVRGWYADAALARFQPTPPSPPDDDGNEVCDSFTPAEISPGLCELCHEPKEEHPTAKLHEPYLAALAGITVQELREAAPAVREGFERGLGEKAKAAAALGAADLAAEKDKYLRFRENWKQKGEELEGEAARLRGELVRIESEILGAIDRGRAREDADEDMDERRLGLIAALRIVQGDRFGMPAATAEGAAAVEPAGQSGKCGRALSTGKPCPDHPVPDPYWREQYAAVSERIYSSDRADSAIRREEVLEEELEEAGRLRSVAVDRLSNLGEEFNRFQDRMLRQVYEQDQERGALVAAIRQARQAHVKHEDSNHCQADGQVMPCDTLKALTITIPEPRSSSAEKLDLSACDVWAMDPNGRRDRGEARFAYYADDSIAEGAAYTAVNGLIDRRATAMAEAMGPFQPLVFVTDAIDGAGTTLDQERAMALAERGRRWGVEVISWEAWEQRRQAEEAAKGE